MVTKKIRVSFVDQENSVQLSFEEITECPLCHYALRPEVKAGFFVPNAQPLAYAAYIPNFCPRCRQMFFAKYGGTYCDHSIGDPHLMEVFPMLPQAEKFSDGITELSPIFVKTYNQAQLAESQGLTEICGIGYRRALEFLVKDHLIHLSPERTDEIKDNPLGKCIKQIDNGHIKVLAERSTWIGNDETHYVRKHEDFDYSDMKRFITAMVRYVDSELTFEEALKIESK